MHTKTDPAAPVATPRESSRPTIRIKRITHRFMIEAKDLNDAGEFEGYASTFGNVDRGMDMVMPGAFKRTLQEHAAAHTMPTMLLGHDSDQPIGDWLEMREDSKGLWAKGKLWLGDGIEDAQKAYRLLKGTAVKGLSIGYAIAAAGASWNKLTGVRELLDLDLFETSVVCFPMNPQATVLSAKDILDVAEITSIRELEHALRDVAGMSARDAKQFITAMAPVLTLNPRDADGKQGDEAERAALAAALHKTIQIAQG